MAGYRKVLVFAGVVGLASVLLWFGKITPQDWTGLLQWSFAAFAIANGAEHVAGRFGTKSPPQA